MHRIICGFTSLVVLFGLIISTKCDNFHATLGHLKSQASAHEQSLAVMGVIERLIPDKVTLFNVTIDPGLGPSSKDTFKVIKDDSNDVVQIVGSSGVAAAWGFHHYLKHFCNCHVSWEANQLMLSDQLPTVNITVSSVDRFRYYQNVCTTSYSFSWWNWTRWEKEIDWMALNGINLALAFTGQEAIWQRVYLQLNLTQAEIDEHFTGPAFFAWGRMGNMRGWDGPLSESWHQASLILQHKILDRMRQLGIIPILPAFAGHVPKAFKRLFPDADMSVMGTWNSFSDEYCCPYLVEPTHPLFRRVGNMFISELIAEFGTNHIYNCDTFNEMPPRTSNVTYLAAIGSAIFEAITDIDSNAIWVKQNWVFVHDMLFWTTRRVRAFLTSVPREGVYLLPFLFKGNTVVLTSPHLITVTGMLQGWLFRSESSFWQEEQAKAFLTSIPLGRMIVLDLQSELHPQYTRLQSYYGQPFIWCMLHNFGGTLGLYGAAYYVNKRIFEGRSMINSTMIGTGLTPEGINQNYVMYDLMNDMAWRSESVNLTEWFTSYATRRYGKYNSDANEAWQLLKSGVYNFQGLRRVRGKYVICRRPSLRLQPWVSVYNDTIGYEMHGKYIYSSRPSLELEERFWYNTSDLGIAWDNLLKASSVLNDSSTYQHDLVDVTRQYLQMLASGYYSIIVKAYKKKNLPILQENSLLFIRLLNDMEYLLASNKAFLLGNWLNSAKALATTQLEQRLYEHNARNQITLWGPHGEIRDYANKQWSGVVADYFLPRWELFFNALNTSVTRGTRFNETEFNTQVFNLVEEPFTLSTSSYPDTPQGNSVIIAQALHKRWRHQAKAWHAVHSFEAIEENNPGIAPQVVRI